MSINNASESYNDSRLKMLTMKYQELSWLSSLQTPEGAMPLDLEPADSPSGSKRGLFLSPYFGAIAAQGFLTDPTTYHRCKKFINWYFSYMKQDNSHEGIVGSIPDYYYLPDGTYYTENTCDSVDSYVALFLSLVKKYIEVTGDISIVINNKNKFLLLLDTLTACYNPTVQLTIAMPSYPVCYCMDNSEVVAGLEDMLIVLQNVTPEEVTTINRCAELLQNIKNAIEQKLWDRSHSHYNYALDEASDLEDGEFYPNTFCQIYPIIYRAYDNNGQVGINSRNYQLYDKFCYYAPEASDLTYSGTTTPHVEVMLYAWEMSRISSLYNKLDINMMYEALAYRIESDRYWYMCHDAGLFLVVLEKMLDAGYIF